MTALEKALLEENERLTKMIEDERNRQKIKGLMADTFDSKGYEKLKNSEEKFQNLREAYESLQIEHKMLQEYVENL